MRFQEGGIYHVYNQGNNRQPIFFEEENYAYFLRKVQRELCPVCDILAWCLMPNHFHFMIHADERSVQPVGNHLKISTLSHRIKHLLSSYARAMNNRYRNSGSLFRQNTKAPCVGSREGSVTDYSHWCLHYIHDNPVKAQLCDDQQEWAWSSIHEYTFPFTDSISRPPVAADLLQLKTDKNGLVRLPGGRDDLFLPGAG